MNNTLVIEAVRKTVTVDCAVEEAFRVFTAGVQAWWPVDTHSIHGDDAWNIRERDPLATEVEVRFLPQGDATRVELEHRGWDALTEGAADQRNSYDTGWDHVLGVYRGHLG